MTTTPSVGSAAVPGTPNLSTAIRTLVTGGFVLEAVERNPGFALVRMFRVDEFGARHSYAFAVADDRGLTEAEIDAARIAAQHNAAQLVVIGHANAAESVIPWDRLLNLFGGPVVSSSALDPGFGHALNELGHNRVPPDLVGRADDLFEVYVRVALEFILAGRVIRYGQERLFERRPDGIALPNDRFCALYDAKAYSAGYPITADTIRQFDSYVVEFSQRYGVHIPRLNSFIVVSGAFVQQAAALGERSTELLASCGVPLSTLTAGALAEIVAMLTEAPAARRAIDWNRIFSRAVVDPMRVATEIEVIRRDGIIGV